MYRLSLYLAVMASVCTVALATNCRTSVPAYDCGDASQACMAMFNGCYHSTANNYVLPRDSLVNLRGTIDLQKWSSVGNAGDLIVKCAKLALEKNKDYFGVEFYGDCYFGDNPDVSQPRVTTEENCAQYCGFDVGGPRAMVLYRVWTP